jgi:hypothetical protein
VDTSGNTHVVWAVLNHNSLFAVAPEPSAIVLAMIAGVMGLGFRRVLL